MTILK